MDVAVAGGHGQIGLRLLRLLAQNGHRARGLIRNQDQATALRSAGAEPALVDLEEAPAGDVGIAIKGADAVVFAAGAGPGSGEARKQTMDLGGAVKLIEACQAEGIKRYVMVSSMGAKDPAATGSEGVFRIYLDAKHDADEALAASGLDFTIVRPGMLTNDAGTGLVTVGPTVERGEVSRDDVASVLFAVLQDDELIGSTFELVGGDTPIDQALATVR
jgi:uncharacterized protein YbjT (DUF2867 family)